VNKVATFKATHLKDGYLSIPKEVVASLLLRRGEEVRVVIPISVTLFSVNFYNFFVAKTSKE